MALAATAGITISTAWGSSAGTTIGHFWLLCAFSAGEIAIGCATNPTSTIK